MSGVHDPAWVASDLNRGLFRTEQPETEENSKACNEEDIQEV